MWRLLALLLLRARTEECPNAAFKTDRNASESSMLHVASGLPIVARTPRSSPVLADIIGLDGAKSILREAVILPSTLEASVTRLFWRSSERGAVLLVGPSGLGKVAAAEAAAAAAGALVLPVLATEVASSGFCSIALAAAASAGRPVVIIIEAVDLAPGASLAIRQCLREASDKEDVPPRIFIVATMARELSHLSASALAPFGYVVSLSLPSEAERKQFLLRLLQQISRIDPQWGSALREAAVSTLANLTSKYTFSEIELLVRRAFIRTTNDEGARDPVALHHFEQILADMSPQAVDAFNETLPEPTLASPTGETRKSSTSDSSKKNKKEVKDPMDGIFGWCNFWLPEALHLPPVVWAMIIFGILAHFMARSTYQPYGHRKRRGGAGARNSLFNDLGSGSPNPYPSFGDNLSDWYPGGTSFANFPPPPGMGRPPDAPGSGLHGGGEGAASASPGASDAPAASTPSSQ